MALSHSSLAISMLLLSLAIISSATDYGYFSQPGVQKPNPEVEKPTLGYLPKPELEKLKTSGSGYAHQEVEEHKGDCMTSKPKIEKPKTDGSGYAPKPEVYEKPQTGYAPTPETEKPKTGEHVAKPEIEQSNKTNGYVSAPKPEDKKSKTAPKPEVEKPKAGYAPKPEIEKPKSNGYGYAPEVLKPKADGYGYAPKTEEETLLSYITGIQGMIYCKSGAKLIPLQGALARITCPTVDKNGHASAAFSVVSQPTDAKGYFFTMVSSFQLKDVLKVTECKAFLEKSPSETCKVATDANKGIAGASLSSYNLLKHRNVKLFSVGPFFYTPESKPAISRGY
ncbi:proline-rich protein 3-like [Diospyros lotus]|uniref:proline-rich protein 3-like n=1 Tax=Diospyros lotus TaxID=55363 RepID=UPI00224CE424|nr:proline-rich protein 3-like [Diospyros lotus]